MEFIEQTIEDCCDILDNRRIPLNSDQRFEIPGEYPYYGANGVQDYLSKYIFDDDLILIAEDGGNFEQFSIRPIAYRVNGKCWVNNHAHVLKAKENFSQGFIFYSLEHKNILFYIAGGTRSKLNQSELKRIKIHHPEKNVADRIAEILSTADEAIEQTEELIAKYQRIKTGLMQDLLTRGIDEHGNIRSKATHKFVVKNGIEVPEEWEVEQIIQTTYLKARIGWQGLKASEFVKEGPYLVTGTDFFDGEINWDKCYHVSEERFKEAKYIQLRNSDLVITKDGTIGKTAMIRNCPEKAVLNSGVFLIRCIDGSYMNEFMYYILNSKYFFDHLFQTQGGSTINHLYQREFEKFYFPCPPKDEQEKIVSLLNQLNENIKEETNHLSKLHSLKTGLMQDLLSGLVRVKI